MRGKYSGRIVADKHSSIQICIKDFIGGSYLSEVYRGIDCSMNTVAVKINTEHFKEQHELMQEIMRIQHPNLLVPTAVFLYESKLVEIMPYVNARTADQQYSWEFSDALQTIRAATRGVACLQEHGFVHHDARARNIFTGDVKVFDFNITCKPYVKHEGSPDARNVAPEFRTGGEIGFAYDVFLLGCTFDEMTMSYTADYEHKIRNADVPQAYEQIIRKATASDPKDRYGNAQEFLNALDQWRHNQ